MLVQLLPQGAGTIDNVIKCCYFLANQSLLENNYQTDELDLRPGDFALQYLLSTLLFLRPKKIRTLTDFRW